MKVAIVGSRTFCPKDWNKRCECPQNKTARESVEVLVHKLAKAYHDSEIISGMANGVDTWAANAAKREGLKVLEYPAEWDKYGKSAGFRRNEVMITEADRVYAVWDGESKGTKHSIDLAAKAGNLESVVTVARG